MLRNLLLFRLAILNACGAAALVWAWSQGFVQMVFAGDSSGTTYGIVGLFVLGLLSVFRRAVKVSRELDHMKAGTANPVNGVKFIAKGEHIADIAQWCAVLGLTGTVIGFIMALYGLDINGDPKAMIAHLIDGMSVAFFTTLAGGLCGMWLELCNRILLTAAHCMIEDQKP